MKYRPIWSSGVSVPSWDLGRPYRCSRTPGLFSLYCSDDNVCSCVEISYKNPLQALEYPPTPAPEIKQKTSHTLRRLTSVTTMPSIARELPVSALKLTFRKMRQNLGEGASGTARECHAKMQGRWGCLHFTSLVDISPKFALSEAIFHRSCGAVLGE